MARGHARRRRCCRTQRSTLSRSRTIRSQPHVPPSKRYRYLAENHVARAALAIVARGAPRSHANPTHARLSAVADVATRPTVNWVIHQARLTPCNWVAITEAFDTIKETRDATTPRAARDVWIPPAVVVTRPAVVRIAKHTARAPAHTTLARLAIPTTETTHAAVAIIAIGIRLAAVVFYKVAVVVTILASIAAKST